MDNLVEIGYTQKPHGLKGEIKVFIQEQYEEDFAACDTIFLNIKGKNLPYFIESIRGGNAMIVKFEDIDSIEKATILQSKGLFIREKDLIPASERETPMGSQSQRLVGYKIQDKSIGEVAVIEEVIEMPQQEMFVITYKKKEVLIPYSDDYIVAIDANKKEILMDLPEGLLDL